MLTYFSYFILYSFIGFLLETFSSLVFRRRIESRKCFLLSALCPVYGLGAIAVLLCNKKIKNNIALTFLSGMVAASAVELITDIFYKSILRAPFWNYSNQPFNINGSICLKYSLIWGFLSLALVYLIHPYIEKNITKIPKATAYVLFAIFAMDAVISSLLLFKFKTKNAVNIVWIFKKTFISS